MNTNADNHYLLENLSPDGINTFTSPDSFVAHWHKSGEILYIREDAEDFRQPARINVGSEMYEVFQGDILFIPSERIHEVAYGCRGNLKGLQYNTEILSSYSDFLPYISRFGHIAVLRHSDVPELTEKLIAKFEKIRSINDSDIRFKRIKTSSVLCEVFMDIADYIDDKYALQESRPAVGPSVMDSINKVCEYANDNLTKDPSLAAAAEYAGLSASYLSRTFKSVLGMSYTEYVNRRKVSLAISLLAADEYSITDICYMSGFNSISTFNRVFLAVTGLCPGQFRKYNVR